MCRFVSVSAVLMLMSSAVHADVKLPAIISDHAVLQRDRAVPIWGWADAGEEVTVALAGQTQTVKAGADGGWMVKFDKLPADKTLTLEVKGKNTLTVKDLLVGEVWLGSGQSNMAMTVNRSKDFAQEQPAAKFPEIRMFKESSPAASEPQKGGSGSWQVCSPQTVALFSATLYFFGRDLHQTLKVPVGLINSSVGGTPITAWNSWDVQKDKKELHPLFAEWNKKAETFDLKAALAKYEKDYAAWKEAAAKAKADGKTATRPPLKPVLPKLDAHHPATLFNGKINPLIPYAIRGAVWYQGENNAGKVGSEHYGLQLRMLVEDWRARWGDEMPFAWVQLPNYHKPQTQPVEESGWVQVREQMTKTLALPKTGMAITLDVGEESDIHPKNKQDVGKRLAMWALADVYAVKGVTASGPLYDKHVIKDGQVIVSFKHAQGNLVVKGDELKGFAICGADKKWLWAKAKIQGDTVILSHPDVKEPTAVRYAWADNPVATLFNDKGVPAAPFRTDGDK